MNRREQLLEIVSPIATECGAQDKYAELLEELFDVIVPEKIGAEFESALTKNDYASASKALCVYYRNKPSFPAPELRAEGAYNKTLADNAIVGKVRVINVDWTFPDGKIDYLFNPTESNGPLNNEWLWQFNRHGEWSHMAKAYADTNDEKYARAFEEQLLSWLWQTDIPEVWNAPGSAYRTIECGIRLLGSWPVAFDGFKRSTSLHDVTLLLMIASMHRQSKHLVENPTHNNWLMMEANGAYAFSVLFPELSDSEENAIISQNRLIEQLERQILPDSMHNELSPDYHYVVVNCVSNLYSLAKSLGREDTIPTRFVELLQNTVNAAILLSTPALTQPKTNDTFTIHTKRFTERAEALFGSKPEYRFVNSVRKEGAPPKSETASAFLNYAGFAVMRADWSADAAYLCFDVGPLGKAHYHQDNLNVIVYKGSQELIYDDGGGQYEKSKARDYARSGYSHNTALVDGMAQHRGEPFESEKAIDVGWISNKVFDYAASTYDGTYSGSLLKPATHKREVRFCKPDFFCLRDTLTSVDGNNHDYEVIFHLDTTRVKKLKEYENGIISDFGGEYEIAIIPLDEQGTTVELSTACGETEPRLNGWYNGRNDKDLHKATTVSRKVTSVKDYVFTTLLIPVKAGDPIPNVTKAENGKIKVTVNGTEHEFTLNDLNR